MGRQEEQHIQKHAYHDGILNSRCWMPRVCHSNHFSHHHDGLPFTKIITHFQSLQSNLDIMSSSWDRPSIRSILSKLLTTLGHDQAHGPDGDPAEVRTIAKLAGALCPIHAPGGFRRDSIQPPRPALLAHPPPPASARVFMPPAC